MAEKESAMIEDVRRSWIIQFRAVGEQESYAASDKKREKSQKAIDG